MNTCTRLVLVAFLALSCSISLGAQNQQKKRPRPKVYTDAATAAQADPDFSLQGEYAAAGQGVQIVALGQGRFRLVRYPGGLPGLGGTKQGRTAAEVGAADARAAIAKGFQRIQRHSTTLGAKAPAGAKVLFDGTEASLKNWKKGARFDGKGHLMAGATSLAAFGDALVHVEFRLPYKPKARGQGRGNSGLYLQARYETQMLDSFGLEGKHNECGGIYSVRAPDLNMCLPPLTWQTYDIEFRAAKFDDGGRKTAPARMTVRLNGVVVHPDVAVPKRTTASPLQEGSTPGPIYLQNHGNPVVYRNIWVLPR